ncbi:YaaA family protein [Oceanivirga salmonicida]|uniref:YaaA family protein n=1 Tax=Oceanivirga salmonicida TaxID=1769291 RepID=UPI000834D847|nr:YaaA family protein [Oceanivirga salmonicida]
MKIIISPSKTKDFSPKHKFNDNLFPEKTLELKKILDKLSNKELSKILKYTDIDKLDYSKKNMNAAIYTYNGLVFKNIDIATLDANLSNLYILSAYYGLLRAYDGISNYRLDMNNNIVKGSYKNMYDFWSNIYDYFINEDFVINLASKEYAKMINPINVINIEFWTLKNGKFKQLSTASKILRGKFARYILENNITKLDDIKKINIDNYKFSQSDSDNNNFIFKGE